MVGKLIVCDFSGRHVTAGESFPVTSGFSKVTAESKVKVAMSLNMQSQKLRAVISVLWVTKSSYS